jgi:hypothetical protein
MISKPTGAQMSSTESQATAIEDLSRQQVIELSAGHKEYVWSIPFNGNKILNSPWLAAKVEDIAREIDSTRKARKRSATDTEKWHAWIAALTANLFAAWRVSPELQVGFPKSAGHYTSSRYRYPELSYRLMTQAFDGLQRLGYLQVDLRGYHDKETGKGKVTKIRGTQKLVRLLEQDGPVRHWEICERPDAEGLRLRDENKKPIDFEETDTTGEMRDNLRTINRALLRNWADLQLPDNEFDDVGWLMITDADRLPLDLSRRTLYRVFNNGSFKQGGRFYGGWWQSVPRDYRRFITINDKPTVELDYRAIHPRILYALEGMACPDDPYDVGLDPKHRDLVKEVLNKMINAPDRFMKPAGFDSAGLGMTFAELQDLIRVKHGQIAKYFKTGFGLNAQFIDSQIAERVLLHFAARSIPCLPIHDSFIMHHGYESELEDQMLMAFREVTGHEGAIKAEDREEREPGIYMVPSELDEIFDELDKTRGYNERLSAWFAHRQKRQAVYER